MESNFRFLERDFPVLARFGKKAETYLYSDSNSCLMKLGMIGETIVNLMFTYDKIPLPRDNSAVERINVLAREGFLNKDLTDILHVLRKVRNRAVHANYESISDGKALLQMAHSLCEWFMQTYGDWNYQNQAFVLPPKQEQVSRQDRAAEEREEDRLIEQAEQTAASSAPVAKAIRCRQAGKAANQRRRSEAETRYLIDQQLRQVGWEADTETLRYSKGTRPAKGRNLAIAEWPTDSRLGSRGRADYALFAGLKLIAVIEAKAEHKDIPSVLDYQGKDYPRCIRAEDAPYQIGTWGKYKVPFTFATNGRPYLEQYRTKSGVWFLDLREPSNAPRALQGWMSPEGLWELLGRDVNEGNRALRDMPYDLLRDKDGLGLYNYQVRAIQAAEQAVMEGKRTVLLAMATGTGKTRTVLGLIYRFLETKRFRRILFLVDRTALGEQAQDTFQEVKLTELMTLDKLYNIKGLQDQNIEKETRVHIATVQGMVRRVLYNDGETMPAVTDYDLIVVDEAHRGYLLDKEMSDAEALYRDQRDYQSKYRTVIEYFDAVKIALTATPALQTTEIFGQPVFKYTYREAVIEGYLVDHDAPHNLVTRLGEEGIHYKAGDAVTVYDPVTGELTNSELLDDELDFDIEDFNKKVVNESFNRTVLEEIARDIDPENVKEEGKTLIYAVNDAHADMIVDILKNIYSERGVDNDAIMKITGSVGGGDPKKVQEAIRRFKNEDYPSIAVTVDLLTTGVDVPRITTLVFLRRVKSRILFEQMLGRATRRCPKIHKTHFEIYDAVGVYESLDPVNTMKPVTANPAASYAQLLDGLTELRDENHVKSQVAQIIAKLQRQKIRLRGEALEHFAAMTGGQDPSQFIADILRRPPEEAKDCLLAHRDLFELLQRERTEEKRPVVISDAEDELLSHTRGYGSGSRPEDYLDAFSEYVRSNMNEIAALRIVCTRPKDLTRESLKNLRLTLDREGFTVQQLNTAISEVTNEEIAADIISLIRRYAIGSELISHEARIRRAVDKLRRAHRFTKQELNWLARMEKYLMEESVLNVSVFDEDSRFKSVGGFARLNKVFQNQLESVVLELNEYLYDDGGRIA